MQTVITYTIIAAAAAFFIWRAVRRAKGSAGCSCCSDGGCNGNCGNCCNECDCGCNCSHKKS
ncbi:MAG: hypothetical protein IKN88_09500 [Bacteroidales bacterium]|nr:hypothetical protein [Bacteroidales bacterium]